MIPGECAITQHRILVMDYKSSLRRMARPRKRKPQIRWWKMKKQEEKDAYTEAVILFEQLGKMGLDKATGPDDLPIEAVKILAKQDIGYVVEAMNQVLQQGIWRKSRMVPIYKGKGDILECTNYRGIKLMCHSMKLWERLIEARLRQITSIGNTQYGFRPGKSTTEPIFILRILQEKYREMNKELHVVFVDLEKAYDRVPRDLIWWCLRKKGVPEGYITIIQDMYNDCETLVSTRAGDTEYFRVGVGLHQGSALSPLLFILIMDVLQTEIGKEPPWVMLFADDLVNIVEQKLSCS